MRNIPDYARVDKEVYRQARKDLAQTCEVLGFEFSAVWDLMVEAIESRHASVLKGKAKHELLVTEAVSETQQQVRVERLRRRDEAEKAAKMNKIAGYVS